MVGMPNPISSIQNAALRGADLASRLVRSSGDVLASQVAQLVPPREMAAYLQPAQPLKIALEAAQSMTQPPAATMGPQVRELALLAQDVYNDIPNPPAGYRVATTSELGALGLNPNDLSSTASPFRARVYVTGSGADTRYVVSFRGSAEGGDWKANFQQGLGLSSDHYRKALYIGQQIARSGAPNVTITGHSLGGGLASAAAIASGRPATTFNAAGLSDNTIDAARAIRSGAGVTQTEQVNAYYVRGEILSMLQDGGDRFVGGIIGGLLGAAVVDAPEAYGNRIAVDPVRPEGLRWYQDNPVSRHGMEWILSGLGH